MGFDLDIVIFILFLTANLWLGLASSRGVTTIKEYAIGNRNFSTATIAATIIATWANGSDFFMTLTETYSNGLYFIWAATCDMLCFLIVGLFFAPRLAEFIGKLSIAEAMGDLFGKHVRVITAISGCIGVGGIIAIQLKASGMLFEYCFNIPSIYGIVISATIITLYSSLGGIKSVTFTDIIQFFTFGTIIPLITYHIVSSLEGPEVLIHTITTHELFDYKQVFDFSQEKAFSFLLLAIFIVIPGFNPAIFQRIAMAKNTKQVRSSFTIAAFGCTLINLMVAWIAVALLSTNAPIDPEHIVKHILTDYSVMGLKGLIFAGVMALIMSTADSYINCSAVLLVHDICKPLGAPIKNELLSTRIASVCIGIFAFFLAIREGSLLDLLISTYSFYGPIVTIPFVMALLGFRSSGKSVVIGMAAGFCALLICKAFGLATLLGNLPAMAANLTFLLGSHYILKQPGGWVGLGDNSALIQERNDRKRSLARLTASIREFNFLKFIRSQNSRSEGTTVWLGIFCLVSTYATIHMIPKEIQLLYPDITNFIYTSALFMATGLLSYPLWLPAWKDSIAPAIYWNISIFYMLICSSFMLVIISGFAPFPIMAFMVNMIIIAGILKWQWATILMVSGIFITASIFKFNTGITVFLNFELSYLLLLFSGILVVFFKPKQEYQELSEERIDYLEHKIDDQKTELHKAIELKYEFLRNLEHEAHTPITGITSMAQVIDETYDKIPEEKRRKAIREIAINAERLQSYVNNLIDLSKLSSMRYDLRIESVNLSKLVDSKLEKCKKLYIPGKFLEDREFVVEVEPDIVVNCDEYYIGRTIENIIINAIQYCKVGKITVKLTTTAKAIEFSVRDSGIGIPQSYMKDIFGAFTTSAKTKTPAGGRGVGLALAKVVTDLHKWQISVESDGENGSLFKFVIKK